MKLLDENIVFKKGLNKQKFPTQEKKFKSV